MDDMNAIALDGVCKSFGQVRAVDGLRVEVPAGSIYGFLGPNGAGKTTTLRMIMNIIRPDSGKITLFGNGSVEDVKHRIGYMPEERGLYRKMTVSRTLAYFGSLKGVSSHELSRSVPRWLERIDLSGWANKRVENLSRGMHQKLQFAVTAINEPDLLILDEPFSGLDPLNQELLKEIIGDMRNEGKTVIFSTHVMHEAEQLCDSILLINKGKVVLDDTLENIRLQQTSGVVSVELDGDSDFVKSLPAVIHVESQGNRHEITLTENGDPQQLLKSLVDRVRVLAFEVKVPSLHEIFINLVGASNADDS